MSTKLTLGVGEKFHIYEEAETGSIRLALTDLSWYTVNSDGEVCVDLSPEVLEATSNVHVYGQHPICITNDEEALKGTH